MAEVKCEECRTLEANYRETIHMAKILGDKDRTYSWIVKIGSDSRQHEYAFEDARGDVSVRDIAMLLKHYLDAGSYSHRLVKNNGAD